jgi:hypothetical protein
MKILRAFLVSITRIIFTTCVILILINHKNTRYIVRINIQTKYYFLRFKSKVCKFYVMLTVHLDKIV